MTKLNARGKLFFTILIILAIVLGVFSLIRDGNTAGRTLQSFYEENTDQRDQLIGEIVGKENDVVKPSVEIVENELVMNYTFKKQLSDKKVESLKKKYEENYKDLNKQGSKMITKLGEKTKVSAKEITMTIRYLNNDGTLIWEHTYEREY